MAVAFLGDDAAAPGELRASEQRKAEAATAARRGRAIRQQANMRDRSMSTIAWIGQLPASFHQHVHNLFA